MDVHKVAILSANLNNFDTPVPPVAQELPEGIESETYHCFTDADFPPITGLTPRFQYRIPKLFSWQMLPGYDYYLWMDGEWSLKRPDSLKWYIEQLGDGDIAFFKHPNRHSIKEEVQHIDDYMNRRTGTKKGQDYLVARYKNGLHREQYDDILLDEDFVDNKLYATTLFIYRDSEKVRDALRLWWLHQSRYFTCDQVVLPYILWKSGLDVRTFNQEIYKTGYMSKVGHHKEEKV